MRRGGRLTNLALLCLLTLDVRQRACDGHEHVATRGGGSEWSYGDLLQFEVKWVASVESDAAPWWWQPPFPLQ